MLQRWCLCRHLPPAQNVETVRLAPPKREKLRSVAAGFSFYSQALMVYPFENRERLGMAEKFSELGILAFALGGPTLGWTGWGCAGVWGPCHLHPSSPAPQQGSFIFPLPSWICSLIPGPVGLECVLPPRTHLKPC